MKLRYSKAEKVAGQKKPVRSNPKTFGKAAAAVVLGTALLAGCAAGKTDVKSSKDIGLQKEAPVVIEDIEEEKAYGEINKKLEKPKLLQENSESLKVEPEEPILFGSEKTEEKNWIEKIVENTDKISKGALLIEEDLDALKDMKVIANENLVECKSQGESKCELTVKEDTVITRVETDSGDNYSELKVAKVDDKGIYLSLETKVMDHIIKSNPKYYRVNFDGGVTAILSNGSEISNEEIDYSFAMLMYPSSIKTEAKPSKKKGEAILVLDMKKYNVLAIKKQEGNYLVFVPSDNNVLSVKKGDEVLRIESADEKSGFVKFSVKDIDSKGITLDVYSEVFMSEPASIELRVNYDGSTSASKGADKFMKEILGIVEFQAKPSKKKGEATIILDLGMGYSEMKMGIIKKKPKNLKINEGYSEMKGLINKKHKNLVIGDMAK